MENDREPLSESVREEGRNDEWPFWPPYVSEGCVWSIWADSSKSLVLALYYTHTHKLGQRERRRERESLPET